MHRVLQLMLWFFGVSSLVWAVFNPGLRNAEGYLEGGFSLPISVGVALLTLGWAVTGNLRRCAFWFALALVGQAVALQLIEAGPAIGYQHYTPFNRLLKEAHPLLLVYLTLQVALVMAGLRSRWPEIHTWLRRTFKPWQLIGVSAVFALSSATVSQAPSVYISEVIFAALVQAVNLGNILLLVWAIPEGALVALKPRLERLFGPRPRACMEAAGRLDRFAILAAAWASVVAALLSYFAYQRFPHIPDEVLYLFQARYFADGALTVSAPPVPEAFSFYLIPHAATRWYSIFPPGWPALLGLGVLVGLPWLVNPMLAGLNILLVYLLIQELYDRRTARFAVLLLCASPWFVFMGMNFMAHTLTLSGVLVAALGAVRARRTGRARWALMAGCAAGAVSLIRPFDGFIIAGLVGLWMISTGSRRVPISALAAFVLGGVLVGALVLPYNNHITGHPTTFPLTNYYEEYFGPRANALGFGPERGLGWAIDPFPGHAPLDALINANLNTFMINVELFGWSTGSLIMIALTLFSGKLRRTDFLMVAVVVAVVGLYSLYWFSGGPDFGARYWYLTLVPLVVLSVRGIHRLTRALDDGSSGPPVGGTRVMTGVLVLCALSLVNVFPWRAIDKYYHYRGMRPDIGNLAREYDFGRSLVLVRGDESDYLSAWAFNPLDPYADAPVYAWDKLPEIRPQVLKAYYDRPAWVIEGPSITRRGYRVAVGPIPASELLKAYTKGTHKE